MVMMIKASSAVNKHQRGQLISTERACLPALFFFSLSFFLPGPPFPLFFSKGGRSYAFGNRRRVSVRRDGHASSKRGIAARKYETQYNAAN